jgi:hypothetical protein
MDEREAKRVQYALEEIGRLATMGAKCFPEMQRAVLANVAARMQEALNPRSDEEVLSAWHEGEISEGLAHEWLGVTQIEARVMLREWLEAQCAEQGHEWREIDPARQICERCGARRATVGGVPSLDDRLYGGD